MLSSLKLKEIVSEARPIIERQLDDAERIAGFREMVAANGGDWAALKALIKAQIQDERDESGERKRVRKILEKAEYSTDYAELLGWSNMNEQNFSSEPQSQPAAQSLPDRTGPLTSPDRREGDDDGQFIQPETATRGEAQVTAAATGVSPVIRAAGDTGAQPAGGEDETAPESGAHSSAAGKPGPVQTGPALAPVYTFTPKPHDGPHSSNGQPRMKGCLNLDACAGSWNKRCYGCERAWTANQSEPESAA